MAHVDFSEFTTLQFSDHLFFSRHWPVDVRCAQAGKPLAGLSIRESYRWVPPAVPAVLPFNVAQLYMRMAEGIREGKSVSPGFDVAVKRHHLFDAIQKVSDTGIRHIL